MFTVLTRTSNRPRLFHECWKSVLNQTILPYHIVSTDDPNDTYPEGDCIVQVERAPGRGHNLYFNTMRYHVPADHPWIVFLDDDDRFTTPHALEIIRENMWTANSLLLWRVVAPSGRLIPSDNNFGNPPVFGDITGIGFCFHVRHWVNWQAVPGGDFLVISELYKKLKPIWIDSILTEMIQVGHGNRHDI